MERGDDSLGLGLVSNTEEDTRGAGMKLKYAIEIPLILVMFGAIAAGTPTYNLIMYRSCVHALNHSVADCRSFLEPDAINHTQELEKEVQEYTTLVTTVKSVMEGVGPAVLSLFLGVWSDKHGRKPVLVWSLLSLTLSSMLLVVYSLLEGYGPWWSIVTIVPVTLGGAILVLLIGAYCHISDVTSQKYRSFRIVLIQVSVAVATTVGDLVSPYLIKTLGTVYVLLIVAALNTFAYAFTIVLIEESMQNATQGSMVTIFNISHAKDMIRACFEKKPNYGRAVILLTIGAGSLSVFTVYGSYTLLYLYSRNRIAWTMEDFTMFSAASSAMWFTGSFIGVTVIQKLFHISDLNFIVISFLSTVMEFLIKTLATKTWQMYVGSAVSLFGTISGPLIRSFLTKTLPGEDIAKIFGFMGATDAFLPLLSPIVYNALYAATISNFPQSIMVLTMLINVACLVLILIVKYLRNWTMSVSYQPIQSGEM